MEKQQRSSVIRVNGFDHLFVALLAENSQDCTLCLPLYFNQFTPFKL